MHLVVVRSMHFPKSGGKWKDRGQKLKLGLRLTKKGSTSTPINMSEVEVEDSVDIRKSSTKKWKETLVSPYDLQDDV